MNNIRSTSLLLIIFSTVVFTECTQKKTIESPEDVIVITIESEPNKELTFSKIVDTVLFYPLETNPQANIGLISKIIVTDSCIYTMDGFMEQCIYCFNLSGDFRFKLDNVGKGPGEYISISDFCITPDNQVVVSEKSGKKIILYDNSGGFIEEFVINFYPSGIAYLDPNLFVVSSLGLDTRIKVISRKGNIINRMIDVDPNFISSYHDVLTLGSGNIYYREVYGDTIFEIVENTVTPTYYIDFQDKKLSKSKYLSFPIININGRKTRQIPPGYRYGSSQLFITPTHISFIFIHTTPPRGSYLSFYERKENQAIFMKTNNGFDDLFGTPNLPRIMGVWNEKFIIPLDSYMFLENYEKIIQLFDQNKPGYRAQLEALKSKISFDSNPILIVFSINEFI